VTCRDALSATHSVSCCFWASCGLSADRPAGSPTTESPTGPMAHCGRAGLGRANRRCARRLWVGPTKSARIPPPAEEFDSRLAPHLALARPGGERIEHQSPDGRRVRHGTRAARAAWPLGVLPDPGWLIQVE
jgi:hypothetical protein